jgi:L,D-transpeptidase ErfK/SrfK
MNISLHKGMTIAIPNKMDNLDILNYAPMSPTIESKGTKVIVVSLTNLAFGAYNAQGQLQYWGPVSGGRGWCPDIHKSCNTTKGVFTIYLKGGGAGCVSSKYPVGRGGAPMPYCMFFKGGYALHGSYNVPGYNDSHGCVRLFVGDAKWLYENFVSKGESVKVVINQ